MELKTTIKDLTTRVEALKSEVTEIVDEAGVPIEGEYGKLSVTHAQKWTFPDDVVDKENELKELKEVAKQHAGQPGGATYIEVPELRFTAKKVDS